jgi:L-seryl-tRNA(Ser) seleniumtransferase
MPNYSVIPSIEVLRQRDDVRRCEAEFGIDATIDALRAAASAVRAAIGSGDSTLATEDAAAARIETLTRERLGVVFRPSLEPVINGTGVIVHTNLGRAPLAAAAIARVAEIARGYSTLEYDLGRGARGRRDVHAETLLCRLTGADAAVVVNNNAAATMIVLAALAAGREVIVSRGELVEIGGGFRVPDVMAQSGAVLREVGTTNKTRAADYAAAIGDRTALILRVHPSNFRIEGFTERPRLTDLVALGKQFNIPVAEDLGSGHLGSTSTRTQLAASSPAAHSQLGTNSTLTRSRLGGRPEDSSERARSQLGGEPTVVETVTGGADLCCFSGDKLLGGPQAGIIVGRAALVDKVRKHPLMRALRVDKMTYAALEATLVEYAAGRASVSVPVQRMIALRSEDIRARADSLARAIAAAGRWRAEVIAGASTIGGGSAPGVELPTWLVAIDAGPTTPDALEERLRRSTPPIIARIEQDRLVIDVRTVLPEQDAIVAASLAHLAAL